MSKSDNLTDFLTDLADGIRTVEGTTDAINPQDFRDRVESFVAPLATKGAATITPTTSNQTIASGTYLTGIQTIKGDSNLVASNIKNGVSIFGVAGTYTGSSTVVTDPGYSSLHLDIVYDYTTRGATLMWNKVPGAVCYRLGFYNINTGAKVHLEHFTITGTQFTINWDTMDTLAGDFSFLLEYPIFVIARYAEDSNSLLAESNSLQLNAFEPTFYAEEDGVQMCISSSDPCVCEIYDEGDLYERIEIPSDEETYINLEDYASELGNGTLSIYNYTPGYIQSEPAVWDFNEWDWVS